MGRNLYIEKIVISNRDYNRWLEGGYLSFDDGVVSAVEAFENSGVKPLKDHYASEDDYKEDVFNKEQDLFWEGYYNYDLLGDFEEDSYVEWDFTSVGESWVIIRAEFS